MNAPDRSPELSRRTFFLKALTGIGGIFAAAVAIPVIGFGAAPFWEARSRFRLLGQAVTPVLRGSGWAAAGALDDFTVGEPRLVVVPREVVDGWVRDTQPVACYVSRTSATEVTAFDHHCTHLGCPLSWSAGAKRFLCPCHGGAFDPSGNVVAGPPPRPMLRYEAKIENGQVLVGPLQEGS
jgi:menaquinol-cytochrome c reductase iron-sulfur subunit